MTIDPQFAREAAQHLSRIQELCRVYPTQEQAARSMSFASIRIAADAVATLGEDYLRDDAEHQVRDGAIAINAAVDELAQRFGSDELDHCRACGAELRSTQLPGDGVLSYCGVCPQPILDAVRDLSDATGADVL